MLESFRKNKKGIIIMLFSAVCACVGQLLWKIAGTEKLLLLFAGLALYGIGAILMILSFRYGKLSVLHPVQSLKYVLSLVLAAVILNEKITPLKVIGVLLIVIGVLFIAGGDEE